MTLPEVPIPAGVPVVHRSELNPATGLYSLRCTVCGAFNATAYGGLDGEYCALHTPEEIPTFSFGRKPRTHKTNRVEA